MASNYGRTDSVMTVGEWIGVLIVLGIPIVNVIMYFIWAFSSTTNENLSNFCKATLLISLIVIAFAILFGGCAALLS